MSKRLLSNPPRAYIIKSLTRGSTLGTHNPQIPNHQHTTSALTTQTVTLNPHPPRHPKSHQNTTKMTLKHNQQIPHNRTFSPHTPPPPQTNQPVTDFRKDWQRYVRVHFDQVHLPSSLTPTHPNPQLTHPLKTARQEKIPPSRPRHQSSGRRSTTRRPTPPSR